MPVLNDWENFDMKDFIAYCGLDCETCEARLATINNDNELRETVYDYSAQSRCAEKFAWKLNRRNSKDCKSIGEHKDA